MRNHKMSMLLFGNRSPDVKCDPSGYVGEDLVECVVTALQRPQAGESIEWGVQLRAGNARRRRDRCNALRGEFGPGARDVEVVRDENDAVDALGAEDLCGSHGVLMRVARSYLRPTHPHAELALKRRLHQFCLRLPSEN